MASGLNSSKTAQRPSHEAIETGGGGASDAKETPGRRLDHEAMESAKRAQNRIHANETKKPGSSEFTKFGR
jgi:hypothetical protein